MTRFEEIIYPLLWMALFFGIGVLYPPFMPFAILAVVILGVSIVQVIFRKERC